MPEDELEPLITECPSCQTRFRVSESQLQRARGRVRCGACLTVFHGIEHLVPDSLPDDVDEDEAREALDALLDELAADSGSAGLSPEGGSREAPSHSARQRYTSAPERGQRKRPAIFAGFEEPAPESEQPAAPCAEPEQEAPQVSAAGAAAGSAPMVDEHGIAKPAPEPEAVAAPETAATPESAAPMNSPVGSAPAETEAAGAAPGREALTPLRFGEVRPPRPLVWAGIVAGVLLLAGQVLWYQFDDWAKEPAWRALYGSVCRVLGCELPVQRDSTQLSARNLVVRIHPDQSASLLVNAVIVNQAEFAQPFPVLELQFTTVRGNLVAARRFEPEEYLAGDARGMTLIPPRTPVQIELSMADPGPDAVNYRLNLR